MFSIVNLPVVRLNQLAKCFQFVSSYMLSQKSTFQKQFPLVSEKQHENCQLKLIIMGLKLILGCHVNSLHLKNKDKIYYQQQLWCCIRIQYNHIISQLPKQQMNQYAQNMDQYDVFNYLTLNQVEQSEIFSIHSHYSDISPENLYHSKEAQNKKQLPTSDKVQPYHFSSLRNTVQNIKSSYSCIDFEMEVKYRNEAIHQGSKDDTVYLNINFKTIIFNYFKQLIAANELTYEETQRVYLFGKRSPSFKSLLQFWQISNGGKEINRICMRFISSSLIVKRILESRCQMGTKLQMIKFVEKLRLNISSGKIVKWKAQVGN